MLEFFSHPYVSYAIYYLMGGVCFNLGYDLVVNKIGDEGLRFNMMERISVGLIWPIFTLIFFINFLKAIFNGNNDND